jgi:LmbE family N-acetylglucosaminyl deacetylase
MSKKLRIMVIGAHPDDCETSGGIALRFVRLGHSVKFLCATNGFSGHQSTMGGALSQIRWKEALSVSKLTGIEVEFLDNNDGYLTPGLPERTAMMRAIRIYAPDIIITHRPNDYHPDHRNTSILVQDCSYLVQVPNVCPMTPVLRYQPAIFYMQDSFKKPYPFQPDLVFDITDVFEDKMRMWHQYKSQMYDWLPWVDNVDKSEIPEDDEERFKWLLNSRFAQASKDFADENRVLLMKKYGERGKQAKYAEGLEICEYGGHFSDEQLAEYFNF